MEGVTKEEKGNKEKKKQIGKLKKKWEEQKEQWESESEQYRERIERRLEVMAENQKWFLYDMKKEWEDQREKFSETRRRLDKSCDEMKEVVEQLQIEVKKLEVWNTEMNSEREEEQGTWKDMINKLSEEDWKRERGERESRRKNVRVLGLKGEDNEITSVVGVLAARTQVIPRVESYEKFEGGMCIKMKSLKSKIELMEARQKLKGTGVWIEEDLTDREERVQEWLEREKERLEKEGMPVQIRHLKAKVGETYWRWSEEEGAMVVTGMKEEKREEEREKKRETKD